MMAAIFSGLASMPRSDMMNPSSIPLGTPKTHFLGLSLMLFSLSFSKANLRSATSSSVC
jgi:hypothetical protein